MWNCETCVESVYCSSMEMWSLILLRFSSCSATSQSLLKTFFGWNRLRKKENKMADFPVVKLPNLGGERVLFLDGDVELDLVEDPGQLALVHLPALHCLTQHLQVWTVISHKEHRWIIDNIRTWTTMNSINFESEEFFDGSDSYLSILKGLGQK